MLINGKQYQTVWMEGSSIFTIDQRLLPHQFKIVELKNTDEVAESIKNMTIRGAPSIGAMAAFGIALSALNFDGNDFPDFIKKLNEDCNKIKNTRPTAYDLFHAIETVSKKLKNFSTIKDIKNNAFKIANEYVNKNIEAMKQIGEHGNGLIKDGDNILTHCNAGALATIDYGTALAPIRTAHYNNKKIHVFVDETRPRCQGSKLTAWELAMEKIPHSVIADNASGFFMKNGEISMVITGADRIAANGDTANKIGTYTKAVLARENGIPFYIAAPLTTIDIGAKTGDEIRIEERDGEEVSHTLGWDGSRMAKVRIAPKESPVKNPAFDVTPAKYIAGIITEKGIVKPGELDKLF